MNFNEVCSFSHTAINNRRDRETIYYTAYAPSCLIKQVMYLEHDTALFWQNVRLKSTAINEKSDYYFNMTAHLFQIKCFVLKAADDSDHTSHDIDCDVQDQTFNIFY